MVGQATVETKPGINTCGPTVLSRSELHPQEKGGVFPTIGDLEVCDAALEKRGRIDPNPFVGKAFGRLAFWYPEACLNPKAKALEV